MASGSGALSTYAVYAALVGSRLRSQLAYRTSFWLTVAGSVVTGLVEFAEIYVVLRHVPTLGGLDLTQAALVFGLATVGFALADTVFGQLDTMPDNLRLGRLEVLLVRPLPLLAQLVTLDLTVRRLGRVAVGLAVLAVVLPRLDLAWTPAQVYLLAVTPLAGAAIYAALFTAAGGLQFFLVDGAEFTASFVYGGGYAGTLPGSVLVAPVRVLFTFVVPATAAAYLPTLLILGLPGPPFLSAWLGWCAPLFAAWAWLLAWLAWRAGTRRFTGAGG